MNNNTEDSSNKTIVLYEPTEEILVMYRNCFLERFKADLIRGIMKTGFHSILMNNDIKVVENNENSHSNNLIKQYKESDGGISKNMTAAILAIFVSDIRNMTHYMETLSPETIKLMELISRNHVVSHATLEKETGRSWLVKSSEKYGPKYKKVPELVWAECTQGKSEDTKEGAMWNYEYYFYFDPKFRPLFLPFFIPLDRLRTTLFDELPELPQPLITFSAERDIFSEIPVLNGLYKQGGFAMTKHHNLSLTSIKKLGTQMKMKEFYSSEKNLVSYLRASIVIPYFKKFMSDKKELNDHPETIIKEVFQQKLLVDRASLFSTVLPHITGIKSIYIRNSFENTPILEFCGFFFDKIRPNTKGWLNFEQLLNTIMLTGVEVSLFSYYHIGDMSLVNKLHDYPVYLDSSFEEITVAFFKGFVYLMAAFGLVEIAHTPYDESDPSPFSCLRYFRLTDLGLYAFDFTKSYTLPDIENKELLFQLDDKNLIAHSLTDDNPYELLLAEMSEPIGNKRYKITLQSMLKGCNTQKDLNNKIDFFKRFISNDLPKVWEDFFDLLAKHNQPMQEIRSNKCIVYKLDPANEELLHLLSTDPVLLKCTHRAEDYLLVVDADKQKEVVARLRVLGYLLELVERYY